MTVGVGCFLLLALHICNLYSGRGPAQAGGNLTIPLISRQIRAPSRADVADVRPCLPDQVSPLALPQRQGRLKTRR